VNIGKYHLNIVAILKYLYCFVGVGSLKDLETCVLSHFDRAPTNERFVFNDEDDWRFFPVFPTRLTQTILFRTPNRASTRLRDSIVSARQHLGAAIRSTVHGSSHRFRLTCSHPLIPDALFKAEQFFHAMHVGLRKHRATYHGPWLLPGVPRAEPLVVLGAPYSCGTGCHKDGVIHPADANENSGN
jgi:hypothetical protein